MGGSMHNLYTAVKAQRVSNAVAAGTTLITPGAGVNVTGFQGVMFLFSFGTLTAGAVTSVKVQESNDGGVLDAYTDILGSHFTVPQATGSNQVFWIDVFRPNRSWVLPLVSRGTANAVLDSILALLYGPNNVPTVHDVTTVGGGTFVPDGVGPGTA
jgi:hypothetical protein